MTPPVEDRLLDITEAAEILKTTKDYLYRHWRELPFAFEFSPRQIRFSLKGIHAYIEEKCRAGQGVRAS
jgi:predicted DNA-binding transcriptional regulator AlpA